MTKPCSACSGPRDRDGQRYCAACHAAYMRRWNKVRARELVKLRALYGGALRVSEAKL